MQGTSHIHSTMIWQGSLACIKCLHVQKEMQRRIQGKAGYKQEKHGFLSDLARIDSKLSDNLRPGPNARTILDLDKRSHLSRSCSAKGWPMPLQEMSSIRSAV